MTHAEYMLLAMKRDGIAYQITGCGEAILQMAKQNGITFPGMPTLEELLAEYDEINNQLK